MQNKIRNRRLILPILGIVALWCLVIFYYLLSKPSDTKNLEFLPKNAEIKLRVDIRRIAEKSTADLLFDSKDNSVISILDSLMQSTLQDTTNAKKMGIELLSNIGLFVDYTDNGAWFGVLLNLKNQEEFQKYLLKNPLIQKNSSYKDNTGAIVYFIDSNGKSTVNPKKYLTQLLKQKNENPFIKKVNSDVVAELISHKSSHSNYPYGDGYLAISIHDHDIAITGNLETKMKTQIQSKYSLSPKGLHLSYAGIPKSTWKQLDDFSRKNNFKIPLIESFSINYNGVFLEEGGDQGFYVQPSMDLLLTFHDSINQDSLLKPLYALKNWGVKKNSEGITIGSKKYIIKMLDQKTLFVGSNPSNVSATPPQNIYTLNGDLKSITSVKGAGFILSFLEVMPPFAASKQFFESVENTSFVMKQTNNKLTVDGKLKFKKDKFALTEIIRFGLLFNNIQ